MAHSTRRSESGIDWERERWLQENGYSFDDTDFSSLAQAEFPELWQEFHELRVKDEEQLAQPRVDPRQEINKKLSSRSSEASQRRPVPRGSSVVAKPQGVAPARAPLVQYPGTPDTFQRLQQESKPIIMNTKPADGGLRDRSSRRPDQSYSAQPPRSAGGINGNHYNPRVDPNAQPPTPEFFTWRDTEAFKKEEKLRGAKSAEKMFPPKPPQNVGHPEIVVRPSVWKSPPLAPQTDYTCGSGEGRSKQQRPRAGAGSLFQQASIAPLPDEPPPGDNVISLRIMFPNGHRVTRRFHSSDSLMDVKNFVSAQKDAPTVFQLATTYPRRVLDVEPTASKTNVETLFEAGLSSSEVLNVEKA